MNNQKIPSGRDNKSSNSNFLRNRFHKKISFVFYFLFFFLSFKIDTCEWDFNNSIIGIKNAPVLPEPELKWNQKMEKKVKLGSNTGTSHSHDIVPFQYHWNTLFLEKESINGKIFETPHETDKKERESERPNAQRKYFSCPRERGGKKTTMKYLNRCRNPIALLPNTLQETVAQP